MGTPVPSGRSGVGIAVAIVAAVLVVLCLGGLAVVGVLAAVAVPSFVTYQRQAKLAEVPANVRAIQVAEEAYFAEMGRYVAAGSEAESRASVGPEKRFLSSDAGWEALGWDPPDPVYGGYWVVVGPEGAEVHGVTDLDGDGELAEYVGGRGWVSGEGVY